MPQGQYDQTDLHGMKAWSSLAQAQDGKSVPCDLGSCAGRDGMRSTYGVCPVILA
jgi:hypothetical protein